MAIDHYSRRLISIANFPTKPDSQVICRFLESAIRSASATPDHLVCDKDSIFWCETFRSWCQSKGTQPRYGAVGKHGSIAVVERAIRTLKDECTRRILVPQRQARFRWELLFFLGGYNKHRSHMTLDGGTPNEIYFGQCPANRLPRVEPRQHWPRRARCARPRTLVAGQPGDRFSLEVDYYDGCRHLPVVSLKRAA